MGNSTQHPLPPGPPVPTNVWWLVCWSALLAGVGEWVLRLIARAVQVEPVFLNPASVWQGPLSAVVLFAPPILLAWVIAGRSNRFRGWLAGVVLAAFLASLDVAMLVPRIHRLALVVLAAGVATQVGWVAMRYPMGFARLVRLSALGLALTVVGGTIASGFGQPTRADASRPATAAGPSVLLLILDTVRAEELSAYGYSRATSPSLAALAGEGVRFSLAVATAPWTLPTHASLFTGRYQRDLSVGWSTPLDRGPTTLAEAFKARGYATGGFIANFRYVSHEYGLGRGFDSYRDYAVTPTQVLGSTMLGRIALARYNAWFGRYLLPGRKDADRVVDEFLAWRDGLQGRPYFGFLNLFDAHEPYAPAAPYDRMFLPEEPPTRRVDVGRRHSPTEVRGLRDSYDGAVAQVDAAIGRLLAELRRDGSLDETIVVVTADHGEEFAEHGHLSHGNGLNFPALHVPLVVRWPEGGIPAGVVVDGAVSLVDVPATLLDLTGAPATQEFPGVSLAPMWQGLELPGRSEALSELYWVPNQPEWYPVAAGNMASLVRGRYHLIATPDGREELYDIVADPFEATDLAREPALADTLAALRRALARYPMRDRGGR